MLAFFLMAICNLYGHTPKIYDCFLFHNELEILEIKLNELYDHVDYFVLVEASETFRGNPKPFYFQENSEKYAKFLDKIIHVTINERLETQNPWDREAHQRNQILRGLTLCNDDDIVIIEDLDEIIRASKLPDIINHLLTGSRSSVTCLQTMYCYFLNRLGQWGNFAPWRGSIATRYRDVKFKSPNAIRGERTSDNAVADAGWHFTYMGGTARVINKLESYSHSEHDNAIYKDPQRIRASIEMSRLVEIDESYPKFIQDNIPYFTNLGLIDQNKTLPHPYNAIIPVSFDPHGWYGHAEVMELFFKQHNPRVVIEVGCWFGLSTRHLASMLPIGGVVYAVDHWLGSAEMQPGQAAWTPKLPYLYEQFLSNVIHAGLTDKIIPIRMESIEASRYLASVKPDLIYIDASHDYNSVYADIVAWYPFVQNHGILCGDDYLDGHDLSIKRAVDQFAQEHHLIVKNVGSFWYYEKQ